MEVTKGYRRYVLLMLMGVYAFNFIDRQLLVIVQESIKGELGLSDTQLGLMTGLAFAAIYVVLGIPVARLADKYNRVNIVAISLSIWSALTVITGTVTSFTQMLLARFGVGVGEAGGSPPAHAIISDYYPKEKRATALSIYSLGIYLGILLGYAGGGYLDNTYGWRVAFYALGLPGILFAVIIYFTIKEPVRGALDSSTKEQTTMSFLEVLGYLFKKKTFIYLAIGSGFAAFVNYALGNWFPSFLSRYHSMDSQQIGYVYGAIAGIGGGIGTFLGGFLSDKLGNKRTAKWYMLTPMLGLMLALPLSMFALTSDSTSFTLTLFFPGVILNAFYLAPCIAVSHNLVPSNMRALTSSVLFFILNLIGLGGGPLLVGILSDYFTASFGDQALRWAMVVAATSGLIGAGFFFMASKSLKEDLEHE